jgi:hypothetical protein
MQISSLVSKYTNLPHQLETYISDIGWVLLESNKLFWLNERHAEIYLSILTIARKKYKREQTQM